MHRADQPRGGRDGQQGERLVDLFPERQQRALLSGWDFYWGLAFGSRWGLGGRGLGGGLLKGLIPGPFGLPELGAQGASVFPVADEHRLAHGGPESLNAPLQYLDRLVHGRNHTGSSRFQQVPLFARQAGPCDGCAVGCP